MRSVRNSIAAVWVLLLLAIAAGGAGAQEAASIRGTVVDGAGKPVSGAEVVLRSDATGRRERLPVSASGVFARALPTGGYTLHVQAIGFREQDRRVEVSGTAVTRVEIVLEPAPLALSGVIVSATRTSVPVSAVPGAVTVVTREQIEQQADLSPNMGSILTQLVPGLSAGTESMSSYGQSFRGRQVVVLIDGVPQSTSRNVSRDFLTIDPSMVERVEVLRGATSVYGEGATGGVINIITRRGGLAGGTRYQTSVSTESSLSNIGNGNGGRVTQSAAGAAGVVDFSVGGAYTRTGGFFDAEGDRIPSDPHGQGGVSDLNSWDAFGKLGLDLGDQRLQLTANYFRAGQDTRYTTDPTVNLLEPGTAKARALPGLDLDQDQGTENALVSLDFTRPDLLGSEVHAQAYYRDYLTRFGPYDGRAFASMGKAITQSFVDSDKLGARFEVNTAIPLPSAPSLLWGLDYADETTSQPVSLMDEAVYEQSGGLVFRKVGERIWTPEHNIRDLGLFAQLAWQPVEPLLLRGGVRHERASVQVDDFTTLAGVSVEGGKLEYEPILFNAGAVLDLTDAVNVYASFSQGFSLADIGRVLRAAGFALGSRQTDAQQVDQYEIGLRGGYGFAQASFSLFRNESDLGTGFDGNLQVIRAPERIHGVEATLDAQPSATIGVGGTFSWAEGDSYAAATDEWIPLDGYRIQPPKITGYLQHQTLPGWQNRLQLLHSGSRDRRFAVTPGAYGAQSIESYTLVDLLSSLEVGPGTLTLGVQNLLNQEYFPIMSQLSVYNGNSVHAAARGATLSIGYSASY